MPHLNPTLAIFLCPFTAELITNELHYSHNCVTEFYININNELQYENMHQLQLPTDGNCQWALLWWWLQLRRTKSACWPLVNCSDQSGILLEAHNGSKVTVASVPGVKGEEKKAKGNQWLLDVWQTSLASFFCGGHRSAFLRRLSAWEEALPFCRFPWKRNGILHSQRLCWCLPNISLEDTCCAFSSSLPLFFFLILSPSLSLSRARHTRSQLS